MELDSCLEHGISVSARSRVKELVLSLVVLIEKLNHPILVFEIPNGVGELEIATHREQEVTVVVVGSEVLQNRIHGSYLVLRVVRL